MNLSYPVFDSAFSIQIRFFNSFPIHRPNVQSSCLSKQIYSNGSSETCRCLEDTDRFWYFWSRRRLQHACLLRSSQLRRRWRCVPPQYSLIFNRLSFTTFLIFTIESPGMIKSHAPVRGIHRAWWRTIKPPSEFVIPQSKGVQMDLIAYENDLIRFQCISEESS